VCVCVCVCVLVILSLCAVMLSEDILASPSAAFRLHVNVHSSKNETGLESIKAADLQAQDIQCFIL